MNDALKQKTLEYVKESSEAISGLQEKVASLEADKATLEAEKVTFQKAAEQKPQVTIEKVAVETPLTFDVDKVKGTISNIVGAGLLKKAEEAAAVTTLMNDPSKALAWLDKLAEREKGSDVKPLGQVEKIAADKGAKSAPIRPSDKLFEARFNRMIR